MSRNALLLCAVLLVPPSVRAQAPTQDKAAVTFNEIERGFFFGVQGGWLFMLNPPARTGPRPFSPGQTAMVEVGYEFGQRVSVSGFVMAAQNRASSTYTGYSENRAYSGDFSTLAPGASARFNFLGFNDGQDVKRTWLYLRGGAGFALFSPKPLLPSPDFLVFCGPGVEYFTRLRHFSVGLEATGTALVTTGSLGFTVTPNLRYAF
jgi:hypothetical protein